jgi:6-phosphofructokinase 1
MNAAFLMMKKRSGYMSCIKNLGNPDPTQWVAAGCPLPAMMGVERRKGKDKPVITKALVELDGAMFKCYEQVREKWGYLDCYQSPGPIQFKGTGFDALNFMVRDPDLQAFLAATEEQENYELQHKAGAAYFKQGSSLSVLSRSRIRQPVTIPDVLKNGKYRLSAIKRYQPYSQLVALKIREQFPRTDDSDMSTHFVEVQPKLIADSTWYDSVDVSVRALNDRFKNLGSKTFGGKIAVVMMGNAAPGGNNIIDGLLKFQLQKKGVELVGYLNGADGILTDDLLQITEESFAPHRNLGGYDYLGKSKDHLADEHYEALAVSCKKNGITGLVFVGATHTLTDAVKVSEYFKSNKIDTNVVVVPATLDGNIRHKFIHSTLGFDTAAKVYSQLIGNMLTDSASAIKYWYFIRLMGRDPSHLALECALKTHPNMCIISEESAYRGESLPDIVGRIADLVVERAAQGKNFGAVVIPEGLLSHVSAYKHLILELNDIFRESKTHEERLKLYENLYKDDSFAREKLTPWSYSLMSTLPDFMRRQLIYEQEFGLGDINLSRLETEKLIAYFVAEELKIRKAANAYSGTFTPVTHFFGYQGRAAHPSAFDCSLGSTLGFASGVQLDAGVNGCAVAVKDVTRHPSQWRVGAVPILALLQPAPKSGARRQQLVVPSQEVQLNDLPYQVFKAHEKAWKFDDLYCNPGPIQYSDFGADSVSETVHQLYNGTTEISEEIQGLCNAIHNQTMFVDHEHLLIAALSALKAAKGALDSQQSHQKSLIRPEIFKM